jgi:hypothetical protein
MSTEILIMFVWTLLFKELFPIVPNCISVTSGYDTFILHEWAKGITYINFLYIYYFHRSVSLEACPLFTYIFRKY